MEEVAIASLSGYIPAFLLYISIKYYFDKYIGRKVLWESMF